MVSLVMQHFIAKDEYGLHASSHNKLQLRRAGTPQPCYIQPRSARDSAWLPVTTK